MRTTINYVVVQTQHTDEAISLAEYLNQHGICAVPEGQEVTCPMVDPSVAEKIYQLQLSWEMFWEHSDKGLFGLPIYRKV